MSNSGFGTLALNFDDLRAGYPTYNKLPAHIQNYMDSLNKGVEPGGHKHTSCVFQVSEALNVVGGEHAVTERSYRRPNSRLKSNFYLGAVEELEF